MSTRPTPLEERYGAPRPGRRVAVVVTTSILALAFLCWLAWTAWFHSNPQIASELVGFEVLGEHETAARIDVRVADPDVLGRCTLRAFAEDHSIVGEDAFEISGASYVDGERVERTIRTERRATAVELLGCTSADQPRPR